jgi:hypothetical protein
MTTIRPNLHSVHSSKPTKRAVIQTYKVYNRANLQSGGSSNRTKHTFVHGVQSCKAIDLTFWYLTHRFKTNVSQKAHQNQRVLVQKNVLRGAGGTPFSILGLKPAVFGQENRQTLVVSLCLPFFDACGINSG